MPSAAHAKFVRSFFLVAGLLVGGNALLNRAVDPYGAYGGCPSQMFEAFQGGAGTRVAKAELARHYDGTTVLVGSSRTEVGYDPESLTFPDGPACNLGLSGTNFHELAYVLDCVLRRPNIRRIVLCFDFQQFDRTETTNFDFEISRFNPALSAFDYHCNLILCSDATKATLKTLRSYAKNKPAVVTPLGLRLPAAMESRGDVTDVAAKLLRNLLQEREALGAIRRSNERLEKLGEVVRRARAADVELIVVIQPVHATMLEVYHCAGLWETHERWVEDVVRVVSDASGGATPVWDFTGYAPYATEPLLDDASDESNRWFWEASHCKIELGELILRRIFARPDADPQFGRQLTLESLPQHFAALRAEHDAWLVAGRDEAQRVKQLALEAGCAPEVAIASAPNDSTER